MPQILTILYQDDDLIAIDKPAGLLVHRSMIDKHETRFAMQMLRDQLGQYVYPVHRLDKPTSGVLLFALNKNIARCLSEQFAQHQCQKDYLAIVRGYTEAQQCIDYPLREQYDAYSDRQARQNKPAQTAITHLQSLANIELKHAVGRYPTARYSLVKLTPETGRKHQLRRHLKHVFHPIVGDTSHGDGKHNHFFRQYFSCHRLLLMAYSLQFQHPISQEACHIVAPFDASFQHMLELFQCDANNLRCNIATRSSFNSPTAA